MSIFLVTDEHLKGAPWAELFKVETRDLPRVTVKGTRCTQAEVIPELCQASPVTS